MKTLVEFTKLAREESLESDTDDIALLDKWLGPENWTFDYSVEYDSGMVITNGTMSVVFDKGEKKPAKKKATTPDDDEIEALVEEINSHSYSHGSSITRLSHPYQEAINRSIRQARHQALGRWGFTITVNDEGNEDPTSQVMVITNGTNTEPVAVVKKPYSPDGDVCFECGKTLTPYVSKNGKDIGVGLQRQMTTKSYGHILCGECNKRAFAMSKK